MNKKILSGFVLAAFLLLLVYTAGCGSSAVTSVNTIENQQKAYDDDVQALKDSVAKFEDASTFTSVDSIKSAFQDLENNYNSAVASGQQVANSKISTVKDSYDNLKTTVNNVAASDQTLQQKAAAVKAALQTFKDQLQQI